MLRFQGESQTICADLFELESHSGGRVISKGRGSVKMGKGWRKKQSLNFRTPVQCYTDTVIVHGFSGIEKYTEMNMRT